MNVKLIIFEIYPSVSEIAKNNEGIVVTLLADTKEKFINVADSLSNPIGTLFKASEDVVKFGLFKGTEYLGIGEIPVSNDVRWVTVQNDPMASNSNKKSTHQSQMPAISSVSNESIRLRVKCCQITNEQNKKVLSPESNTGFPPSTTKFNQKKKPLIRISNLMRKTASNMGKKHHSCIKISKNTPDRRSPYLKRMIYRNFHNKSVEENITNNNIYPTDMYNTTNSMNMGKTELGKHKSDNHVSSCYSFQSPCMNKTVIRMDYKTETALKKTKTLNNNTNALNVIQDKYSLESQIINQSFENNIKNDEMIDRKTTTTEANLLEDNNAIRALAIEDHESALYDDFIATKNDFNILYDENYLSNTVNENMKLEMELFIEKVSELQNKYHLALNDMSMQYNFHIRKVNEYNEGMVNVMKMKSKLVILCHQYEFSNKIDFDSLNRYKSQVLLINRNEIDFWNRALNRKKDDKDKDKGSHCNSNIKKYKNHKDSGYKERLREIVQHIFNDNTNKTKIQGNSKSNCLNASQKSFLGKMLPNASRNSLNGINDTVTMTIEQLKNNLKNKMLPLISNDNDGKSHIEALRTSSNTTTNNNSFNVGIMQKQRPKKVDNNVKTNSNYHKVKSKHLSLTKYR